MSSTITKALEQMNATNEGQHMLTQDQLKSAMNIILEWEDFGGNLEFLSSNENGV